MAERSGPRTETGGTPALKSGGLQRNQCWMLPGKQEANQSLGAAGCQSKKLFPRGGARTFQKAASRHLFSSFLGLAICQRFHGRRPTRLVFSPVVGAAHTFPGPTHPPSSCWECCRLMPKVALPPQGHKGPASLLPFWIPRKGICSSRLPGSAEAWGYSQQLPPSEERLADRRGLGKGLPF